MTLSYGQVMWLLLRLGYGAGVTESTFDEYLKSLRKLGIPFGRETRPWARKRAHFLYCHIMELAVVLSLRIYHVVPDAVLHQVMRHRTRLYGFYRQAYAHRATGVGKPILVTIGSSKPIEVRGLTLDLGIKFSGGQMIKFGPPKLLSPSQNACEFVRTSQLGNTFLPINLSVLSEKVVRLAQSPPRKRRRSSPGNLRFPDAPSVRNRGSS